MYAPSSTKSSRLPASFCAVASLYLPWPRRKADGITPLTLGYAWGVPIDVRHEPNPSDEYVMEVHAKYIKAIEGLFERHKARFGYDADETIEVVSAKKAA